MQWLDSVLVNIWWMDDHLWVGGALFTIFSAQAFRNNPATVNHENNERRMLQHWNRPMQYSLSIIDTASIKARHVTSAFFTFRSVLGFLLVQYLKGSSQESVFRYLNASPICTAHTAAPLPLCVAVNGLYSVKAVCSIMHFEFLL